MTFDPLNKAQSSETFCIMPWVHQFVDAQGSIRPCCIYDFHAEELGSLKKNTLEEIWNNDKTKELRLRFLNGEKDSACFRCYNRGTTMKTGHNNIYMPKKHIQDIIASTQEDGSLPKHELYYMDVRFNNLCNFTCRTCSPHFSTSWILDHRKLYNIPVETSKDPNNLVDSFHFPGQREEQALEEILPHLETIDYVYFAGGEPLMQKEHYAVLKQLIKLKKFNIKIRYNTNFSKLVNNKVDVIDYWKQFKDISIHASIDGSYAKAEYWRKGTVWEDIVDNRERLLKEVPHAKFVVNYTVSWTNALNMLELHKEWIELGLIKPDNLITNFLDQPEYYCIKNIPLWKKKKIENACLEHCEWLKSVGVSEDGYSLTIIKGVIDFMYSAAQHINPDRALSRFKHMNEKLDDIRNENFYDVFPEHEDMREYIRNL